MASQFIDISSCVIFLVFCLFCVQLEINICRKSEPRDLDDLMAVRHGAEDATAGTGAAAGGGGTAAAEASDESMSSDDNIDVEGYGKSPGPDAPLSDAGFELNDELFQSLGMTEDDVVRTSSARYQLLRCTHPDGCAAQRAALIKSMLNLIKKALRSVPQFLRRGELPLLYCELDITAPIWAREKSVLIYEMSLYLKLGERKCSLCNEKIVSLYPKCCYIHCPCVQYSL